MLRKIEGFLVPSTLEPLRDILLKKGVEGMSVMDAQGIGLRSKKDKDGKPIMEKRLRVEIVVPENQVDDIIRTIRGLAGEGEIGAGVVFVLPVEDAFRLRTREAGSQAIT